MDLDFTIKTENIIDKFIKQFLIKKKLKCCSILIKLFSLWKEII